MAATDADEIERSLRLHYGAEEQRLRRMVDEQLRTSAVKGVGWAKPLAVGAVGIVCWVFSLGRAEAEYIKRPELVADKVELGLRIDGLKSSVDTLSARITTLETSLALTQRDIAYIREKLDSSSKKGSK